MNWMKCNYFLHNSFKFRMCTCWHSCDVVLVLGGGTKERRRAQIRPSVYGAACIHRGVCPCAWGLPAHGARDGGGQEVPVPCEFDSLCLCLYLVRRESVSLHVSLVLFACRTAVDHTDGNLIDCRPLCKLEYVLICVPKVQFYYYDMTS